mgnify:CR=1 FL=1
MFQINTFNHQVKKNPAYLKSPKFFLPRKRLILNIAIGWETLPDFLVTGKKQKGGGGE